MNGPELASGAGKDSEDLDDHKNDEALEKEDASSRSPNESVPEHTESEQEEEEDDDNADDDVEDEEDDDEGVSDDLGSHSALLPRWEDILVVDSIEEHGEVSVCPAPVSENASSSSSFHPHHPLPSFLQPNTEATGALISSNP